MHQWSPRFSKCTFPLPELQVPANTDADDVPGQMALEARMHLKSSAFKVTVFWRSSGPRSAMTRLVAQNISSHAQHLTPIGLPMVISRPTPTPTPTKTMDTSCVRMHAVSNRTGNLSTNGAREQLLNMLFDYSSWVSWSFSALHCSSLPRRSFRPVGVICDLWWALSGVCLPVNRKARTYLCNTAKLRDVSEDE